MVSSIEEEKGLLLYQNTRINHTLKFMSTFCCCRVRRSNRYCNFLHDTHSGERKNITVCICLLQIVLFKAGTLSQSSGKLSFYFERQFYVKPLPVTIQHLKIFCKYQQIHLRQNNNKIKDCMRLTTRDLNRNVTETKTEPKCLRLHVQATIRDYLNYSTLGKL